MPGTVVCFPCNNRRQLWLESIKSGANGAKVCRSSAEMRQAWPYPGRIRSVGRFWPAMLREPCAGGFSRQAHDATDISPKLAQIGPLWAEVGQTRPGVGRIRSKLGQCLSNVASDAQSWLQKCRKEMRWRGANTQTHPPSRANLGSLYTSDHTCAAPPKWCSSEVCRPTTPFHPEPTNPTPNVSC